MSNSSNITMGNVSDLAAITVTQKTPEEVIPVINEAVKNASMYKDAVSESKDVVSDKDGVKMEAGISVQDTPTVHKAETVEPQVQQETPAPSVTIQEAEGPEF